jgi:hypothetical protein
VIDLSLPPNSPRIPGNIYLFPLFPRFSKYFFIQLIREIPGEIPVDIGAQVLPAGVEAGGGGKGGGVTPVQVILFEDTKARGTGGRHVCVCMCMCVCVYVLLNKSRKKYRGA